MNNSQIATALALRELHCWSLDNIDARILLQKKIYLAQDAGVPLGYGYSWYIHGPYSTDLTADVYQIIPEGNESISKYKFRPPYDNMIDRVNGLERDIEQKHIQIGVVQWYELIVSIAYWYKCGYDTEDKILEKIRVTKPQFSVEQTNAAFESYQNFKRAA